MKFTVIIPARFASQRLPGKPLLDIGGKPMIWHTWQRAIESGAERLVIATDDPRIEQAAAGFGAEVVMTGEQHRSGTDRVAEAAAQMGLGDDAIIVNLQGDEPMMPPGLIRQAAETLLHQPDAQLATLATAVHSVGEFLDTNVVKLVIDETGRALYFSRAPIPWPREGAGGDLLSQQNHGQALRHLGIYAYRGAALQTLAQTPVTPMEEAERLEQLRALWIDMRIQVAIAAEPMGPGVDSAEDLDRVRSLVAIER